MDLLIINGVISYFTLLCVVQKIQLFKRVKIILNFFKIDKVSR